MTDATWTALGTQFFQAMATYGGTAHVLMKKHRGIVREDEAYHYALGFFAAAEKLGLIDAGCAHFWLFGSGIGDCEDAGYLA